MSLESKLQSALRRQDPSPGFAARIQQQVEARRPSLFKSLMRPMLVWPSVAVAMTAVSVTGLIEYRHIQEERAGRQAILALRIASEKLNHARSKVLKLNQEN